VDDIEPSLALLQVLRALPAGFFFGWAAPKKNKKSAAFQLCRLHSTAKKLIKSRCSRIKSPKRLRDSKEPQLRFVSF
jgi:hypothetical protein